MNFGSQNLIGSLLQGPVASRNDIDLDFIAQQLFSIAMFLKAKKLSTNGDEFFSSSQPWTSDMRERDFSDPMQNFLAGFGST